MKDNKLESLKDIAIFEITLLEEEFNLILDANKKKKPKGKFTDYVFLNDTDKYKMLYEKRKDRKYASITVEIYSIIEQLLKDIHQVYLIKPFQKNHKKNILLDLQEKLGGHLNFISNKTYNLAMIRNYIVHENFSFKKARIDKDLEGKSKEVLSGLFKEALEFIKNIKNIENEIKIAP
ncbi:nucleoside-diphosphate sugar epimerase [Rummeliibacillus stabekisii]|uniref:nucleoside-diphosphate sugar epimerase n=1 Tax=Rummeliibacillus stabekisii TaxID=241244 RepID=UPI00371F3587